MYMPVQVCLWFDGHLTKLPWTLNPLPGDNARKAGHQDEKLPQVVGGGLGVPGSKDRVLKLLAEVGYDEVALLVEVRVLDARVCALV
jgi:hypothetical protein